MSTITNIKQCKAKMSSSGWALFCQHKKVDTLAPFDPTTCSDDETIMLTKHELLSYEYLSGRKTTILAKIGERSYELPDQQTISKCREIYAYHIGDQNSLEDKFEEAGVEFTLDLCNLEGT